MASVGRARGLTLITWCLVKGMRTFSSAAESGVSDELRVNFIDYVNGFWHKLCGRHSKQNLERFQVRMKYFSEAAV